MTVNLDQVLFARAEWRIRFLVPCWIMQVGVLLSLVGLFAYRLSVTCHTYDDEISHGRDPIVQIVYVRKHSTYQHSSAKQMAR